MLFSVIMCTYNSEKTLVKALDSVLQQSFAEWEMIILDNGSTDATIQILQEYEKKDSRISCIYRDNNVGWCKGISICLERAQGKYMMFLGADDYIATERTFADVQGEIEKHHPDVVWTANEVAVWEDGIYKIASRTNPSYRVLENEDKLTQLQYLMDNVYYNSVMHYVSIDFLKAHNIDFYRPFYGDCQGMTEVICKAKKMVVMDKVGYVLIANTSQTASKVNFDYDVARQWQSVKDTLGDLRKYSQDAIGMIAYRIFLNLACMCDSIAAGGELRDDLMNGVQKGIAERFFKVEEWISSDAFGEMMNYAGRLQFEEHLIGAAGVLYWLSKKYGNTAEIIREGSHWLADFVETAMDTEAQGNVCWKLEFNQQEAETLLQALMSQGNGHRIGAELLLRENMIYKNQADAERIRKVYSGYRQIQVLDERERMESLKCKIRQKYPLSEEAQKKVEIGDFTYGSPFVATSGNAAKVKIGKFCSFAKNVMLLLEEDHRTDWVSTYPFNTMMPEISYIEGHPHAKGDIVIGNDVWVATEARILSGVTIGDGAVIAANAVVAKSVPPYSVVVGNPGRVVKQRFDDITVERLLEMKWWDWEYEDIYHVIPLLQSNQMDALYKYYLEHVKKDQNER